MYYECLPLPETFRSHACKTLRLIYFINHDNLEVTQSFAPQTWLYPSFFT